MEEKTEVNCRNAPVALPLYEFLREVFSIYHRHLWLFLRLIAPAVAFGYIAVILGRERAWEIERYLPHHYEFVGHEMELFQIWAANLVGFLVSWIVYCFSFGAICVAVRDASAGGEPGVEECFGLVRNRSGPFFRLSFLLVLLLSLAGLMALLIAIGIAWLLRLAGGDLNYTTIRVVSVTSIALGLLLFSRFGLAMPALILGNSKVNAAIFQSDKLTEGHWLILGSLLIEAVAGLYLVAFAPFWFAARVRLAPPSWVLVALSICGIALVQPHLFIGLALLYVKMTKKRN